MGRLVVTGASGFVGRHLCRRARSRGLDVIGIARNQAAADAVAACGASPAKVGLEATALAEVFEGAAAVVHLAQIGTERPGATYETVNVGGTRNVVRGAQAAGVRRIVFLSGLGVAHYGLKRRCTNPYFLSKLKAEVELFSSDRDVIVFRPSYIVGSGNPWILGLVRDLAGDKVQQVGDGSYRLQPIAIDDAVDLILREISGGKDNPLVCDMVGPEPLAYRTFLRRLRRISGAPEPLRVKVVPVESADRWVEERGMSSAELDCLLCDEVSDPRPLESLLGRALKPLDEALVLALGEGDASARSLAGGS